LGSLSGVIAYLSVAPEERYISPEKHEEFILFTGNLYNRQLKSFSAYIRRKDKIS